MKEKLIHQYSNESRSRSEVREALYDKIERKISVLKDVWVTAQGLPVPSPSDPLDTLNKEQQKFQDVAVRMEQQLPEAVAVHGRITVLNQKETLTAREKRERSFLLLESDDFGFLSTVGCGIEELAKKREKMRGMFRQLGGAYLLPGSYDDLLPQFEGWQTLRGCLKGIIPQRFSVSLAINDEAMRLSGYGRRVDAVHLSRTIWN